MYRIHCPIIVPQEHGGQIELYASLEICGVERVSYMGPCAHNHTTLRWEAASSPWTNNVSSSHQQWKFSCLTLSSGRSQKWIEKTWPNMTQQRPTTTQRLNRVEFADCIVWLRYQSFLSKKNSNSSRITPATSPVDATCKPPTCET